MTEETEYLNLKFKINYNENPNISLIAGFCTHNSLPHSHFKLLNRKNDSWLSKMSNKLDHVVFPEDTKTGTSIFLLHPYLSILVKIRFVFLISSPCFC